MTIINGSISFDLRYHFSSETIPDQYFATDTLRQYHVAISNKSLNIAAVTIKTEWYTSFLNYLCVKFGED